MHVATDVYPLFASDQHLRKSHHPHCCDYLASAGRATLAAVAISMRAWFWLRLQTSLVHEVAA
jgi:hypothetical protein